MLGRSRFRSGRFGDGKAAGELVLDCQSCPVYHLDVLIVLQSQLSSLENCVDLHSKKPPVHLYLWFTGTKLYHVTITLLFSFITSDVAYLRVWTSSCMDADKGASWRLYQSSSAAAFPFAACDSSSPSALHVRALMTRQFPQGQPSSHTFHAQEFPLYASVTANRHRLMKTEHLTREALTAQILVSDSRASKAILTSQICF